MKGYRGGYAAILPRGARRLLARGKAAVEANAIADRLAHRLPACAFALDRRPAFFTRLGQAFCASGNLLRAVLFRHASAASAEGLCCLVFHFDATLHR